MSKFSKLFAIFAILFLLMGVTGCVFVTTTDTTAPSNVKSVSHTLSDNTDPNKVNVKFTWTNPSDIDYAKVEVWWDEYTAEPQFTANYPDHEYTLRGLTKGRSYKFTFYCIDYTGNKNSGFDYTVTVPGASTPTTTIAEISTAAQLKSFFTNTTAVGKLTADITITEQLTLSPGTAKTLDLDGKKITLNNPGASYFIDVSGGDLTIKDSSKTASNAGTGKIESTVNNCNLIKVTRKDSTNGKLAINGGTFTAKGSTSYSVVYVYKGSATITDGKLEIDNGNALWVVSDDSSTATTITGGTFEGSNGIRISAGAKITKISGATVNATHVALYNYGTIDSIEGTNFNVETLSTTGSDSIVALYNNEGTINNIIGGNFSATISLSGTAYGLRNTGTITAHGGNFHVYGTGNNVTVKNVNVVSSSSTGIFNNSTTEPKAKFYVNGVETPLASY